MPRQGCKLLYRAMRCTGLVAFPDATYCSVDKRDMVRSFFEPRIATLRGAPRILTNVVESIEICAATARHERVDAAAYFRNR